MGGIGPKKQVISDTEFELTIRTNSEEGDKSKVLTQHIMHNKDEGSIVQVASTGNELLHTTFWKIVAQPLQVEHWIEKENARLCGSSLAMRLQYSLDNIIHKAEDGWFW